MKKNHIFIVLSVMLLLCPLTTLASDLLNVSEDTPAILATLNKAEVTPLDDAALTEIRGQSDVVPQYVMGKIWLLNGLDCIPFECRSKVSWAYGIPAIAEGWKYGRYGGPNHSGPGPAVDNQDKNYAAHDTTSNDAWLIDALSGYILTSEAEAAGFVSLEFKDDNFWGPNYYNPKKNGETYSEHFDYYIYVSRLSVLSAGATRFFFLWHKMGLPNYARLQALFVGNLIGFPSP